MNIKSRAQQLMADIPAVFLVMKSKQTPWYAKALAGLTVAYALSPIDLIPDFIPVLGYLDDLIILPLLIALTIRCIPREVFRQCREQSQDLWKNGKPQRWYYSLPILALWVLVLILIPSMFL